MASTPSIEVLGYSPKHSLPTEEEKLEKIHEPAVEATPSTFQKIVAELVGTYILMFAGCGAALIDRERSLTIVGIAIVWGLALMVIIYTVGHISGAHVNPAVTIAFAAARRFPLVQVPVYVLAQVIGAILACLTLRALFNDQGNIRPAVTQYSSSTTDLQAIVWEFIITFILMFTICGVASDHRANNQFCGVAIGATVLFNVMVAGPITGASMNPARSIGPAIVSGTYKNLWVFVVAPILGAMTAALVYFFLRLPEPDNSEENTKGTRKELYSEP
ncbi:hypothetical protein NMG60_11031413 [Bertholletia excelsa]